MGRNLKQHMKFKGISLKRVYQACALLLFLAVASSMLATAPMAKYVTQATSADSARVAKFKVYTSPISETSSFTVNPTNTTAKYEFRVTCDSEVASKYDVIVTLPSSLSGVTLKLDNAEASSVSTDGKTYTWTNARNSEPGTIIHNHDLTFTRTDGATPATYSGITIKAVVSQVQ